MSQSDVISVHEYVNRLDYYLSFSFLNFVLFNNFFFFVNKKI